MKNSKNYGKILLQDEDVKQILKSLILEKYYYYLRIEEKHDSFFNPESGKQSRNKLRPAFLRQVLEITAEFDELKRLETDLTAMCYQLEISSSKSHKSTKWQRDYQYAKNISIEQVLSFFFPQKNFRQNLICPFHKDKQASLKVYIKNNYFICFACQARGSPIDFVMQYQSCSFKEAILYLNNI